MKNKTKALLVALILASVFFTPFTVNADYKEQKEFVKLQIELNDYENLQSYWISSPRVYKSISNVIKRLRGQINNFHLVPSAEASTLKNLHIENYTEYGQYNVKGINILHFTHSKTLNPVVCINGIYFGTVDYYTEYSLHNIDTVFITDISFLWESVIESAVSNNTRQILILLHNKLSDYPTAVQTTYINKIILILNNKYNA